MARETTKYLLGLLNDGAIDPYELARNLLGYLSEDDVRDFAERNEYLDDDADENYEGESDKDELRLRSKALEKALRGWG